MANEPSKMGHKGPTPKRDGTPTPQKLSDRLRQVKLTRGEVNALADQVAELERKTPAWQARRLRDIVHNNNMDDRAREQLLKFAERLVAEAVDVPEPAAVAAQAARVDRLLEAAKVVEQTCVRHDGNDAQAFRDLEAAIQAFAPVVSGGSPADG